MDKSELLKITSIHPFRKMLLIVWMIKHILKDLGLMNLSGVSKNKLAIFGLKGRSWHQVGVCGSEAM